MKQTVYAARTQREPYKITEAQKDAARDRRRYGKPKLNKRKAEQ